MRPKSKPAAHQDRFKRSQRRAALRRRAIAYLGGKCRICGYDRCDAALDMHHTDPLEKDFTISSVLTNWETIRRELDKCVILCARCHREVHDGLHPSYLDDPNEGRSLLSEDAFDDSSDTESGVE